MILPRLSKLIDSALVSSNVGKTAKNSLKRVKIGRWTI